ncbi:MAG: hypothetical protein RLZZ301_746 [Bacteroidota bacterium]
MEHDLDQFEQHLKRQLQGQKSPDELMWKRLHDVIGKRSPWYAKALVKYSALALLTFSAGSLSTYLWLRNTSNVEQSGVQVPQQQQQQQQQLPIPNQLAQELPTGTSVLIASEPLKEATSVHQKVPTSTTRFENLATELPSATEKTTAAREDINLSALETRICLNLPLSKATLQHPRFPKAQRAALELSLVNGWDQANHLPSMASNFAPNAYQVAIPNFHSVRILLAYVSPYHLTAAIGIQNQRFSTDEHFHEVEVFSYDQKEHYHFRSLFGDRVLSEDELEDGPWPIGGPPTWSDTSHVHVSYRSQSDIRYLQFPISVGYRQSFGRFAAEIGTSLLVQKVQSAQNTLTINGYAPLTQSLRNQLPEFGIAQSLQFKLLFALSPSIQFMLEPNYRIQFSSLNSVSNTGIKPHWMGINAGLNFKF